MPEPPAVVIGIGHPDRAGDGVGRRAVRRVRGRLPGVEILERSGEATGLIADWSDRPVAYVVDAVRTGASPGTVHRLEVAGVDPGPLPSGFGSPASSHGLGLATAVELGRTLGSLPARLVVLGVEVDGVELGGAPDPALDRATEEVARLLLEELGEEGGAPCTSSG